MPLILIFLLLNILNYKTMTTLKTIKAERLFKKIDKELNNSIVFLLTMKDFAENKDFNLNYAYKQYKLNICKCLYYFDLIGKINHKYNLEKELFNGTWKAIKEIINFFEN